MFTGIYIFFRNWFGPRPALSPSEKGDEGEQGNGVDCADESQLLTAHTMPYDESLLEKSRTQWQFGDWESLGRLDEVSVAHHPERAKLALLVASAHQQLNDHVNARHYIKLAQQWGCDKKLIAGLLIAGVHNTLGRAAALMQDDNHALEHFKAAVEGVRGDTRLACHARLGNELARLNLRNPCGSLAVFHTTLHKDR